MRKEPLNLTHQLLLETRFQKLGLDISEYTFANGYLFRHVHDLHVLFSEDIYLQGKTRDGLSYLMPTTIIQEINWQDLENCLKSCDFLFPIPTSWSEYFDKTHYQISKKDTDSDYLYTVDKLSKFPGRHLSGRRNLVKQFLAINPNHHTKLITAENTADALHVLKCWQEGRASENSTDYQACFEALQLMEKLNLAGHLYYVDQKPIGFILGEKLNSKTFVVHFVKALKHYKGIYQYIYQEISNSLLGKYEFINLEQDLGLPELRQAKGAYNPDQLIPKLRISLWKSRVY